MRYRVIVAALLFAVPAFADSRFRITVVPRPELATGKGQCDIRLEIDNEVEITVRRDQVLIHTISGEDARDDGSDCNVPLPARDMSNFAVQTVDSRAEIRVLQRPSARNDFAVVVRILDAAPGFGRYRFRLSWDASAEPTAENSPPKNEPPRPPAPAGFAWNNATTYNGHGAGETLLNDRSQQRLGDVRVDIDLGGKVVVSFTTQQAHAGSGSPHPVVFNGAVMAREGSLIRADMVTEDRRLHGTMTLSVDDRHSVNSVSMNATDGQDRLHLSWDRR
jgi:hypothetical protein